MPPRRKGFKGKRRGNKRRARKPRAKPMIGLMPSVDNVQKAQISETFMPNPATVFIRPGVSYGNTITITNFPRAMKMAELFKFYRCKRVMFEYLPDQTTFQAGNAQVVIPYAYYAMNRDGTSSFNTKYEYLAAGARPIKFTKKILVSYKPNLAQVIDLLQTSSIPTGSSQNVSIGRTPIYDKWISTDGIGTDTNFVAATEPRADGSAPPYQQPAANLSIVQYFGHNILFDQQGTVETTLGYTSLTVEWEFKVPRFAPEPPSSI